MEIDQNQVVTDEVLAPDVTPLEIAASVTDSPLLRRGWLLLTVCLPLALLILLLFSDWCLVCGEMTVYNQRTFWTVMAIAAAGLLGAAWLWRCLPRINVTWGVVMLLWLLAAIVISTALQHDMRPDVEEFILPQSRWLEYLMICYMPGVFYLLVALARLLPGKLIYPGIAATLLIPVAFYFFFTISFRHGWFASILPSYVFISLLILLGAGFYLGMIKVMLHFIPKIFAARGGRTAALVVVAWILPFGGLLLNISIPFPVDFQDWRIYAITMINGMVLLLPVLHKRTADLTIIFLKGACYPFALYFFLVFLPWLPLSLLAIIACGAGFLILAPTFLFIIQNHRLAEDYTRLKEYLSTRLIIAAFALGLLVMPLYFIVDAFCDKAEIEHAVRVFFNSPYDMPMAKQRELSISRIIRTQQRLFNAKHGVEIPFLSRVYNRIVFSDLVLSDDKINRIYYSLTGNNIEAEERFNFTKGLSRRRNRPLTGLVERRSSEHVKLRQLKSTPLESGGARLWLTIDNNGGNIGEYVANITLPPGVVVAGLTLKINGSVVPGRIFERKSAFWIYEKITTVNRDPALLSYSSPNLLRLLVFPVPPGGSREVTVDLIYPGNAVPEIDFDGRKTILPSHSMNTGWELIGAAELRRLPVLKRRPELVFILDRGMKIDQAELLKRLQELAGKTSASSCRVISGIFAAGELSQSHPLSGLPEALQWYARTYAPGTPGFTSQNVVKGAILRYHALDSKDTYPVFVLLSNQKFDRSWHLADFTALLPECDVMIVSGERSEWCYYNMLSNSRTEIKTDKITLPTHPVCRLPNGQLARQDIGAVCQKANTSGDNAFSRAMTLHADSRKLRFDPSLESELLPQLVKRGKETGILIPQTAYIVLETEAQWKTLEKAEKNKLEKSSAYDLEEVRSDEPTLWLLLPFAIMTATFVRRPNRHSASAWQTF